MEELDEKSHFRVVLVLEYFNAFEVEPQTVRVIPIDQSEKVSGWLMALFEMMIRKGP